MKYLFALLAGIGAWISLSFIDTNYFSIGIPDHVSRDVILWATSVGVGFLVLAKMD